jgi:phosphoribosylamine--glycine ligase
VKVLIVGSGGREHALAWALGRSAAAPDLYAAPGNPGIAELATPVPIGPTDVDALLAFARDERIDLAVVGPEAPLAAGIVDRFEAAGLRIFGPSRAAARLEASKGFAKEFLARHRIPTARFRVCASREEAAAALGSFPLPVVLKADGLAAGKGVVIAPSREEALGVLDDFFVRRVFGDAGSRVVVEEFLAGEEASLFAVTDGERFLSLVPAQDHKRAGDGDTGPNTGGMGAYAPTPFLSGDLLRVAEERILAPTLAGMRAEGTPYRGLLYAGLMVTEEGPRVIEFNCRFGDPETQAVLRLLDHDLLALLDESARGRLTREGRAMALPGAAICLVLASGGYPGLHQIDFPIDGLEELPGEGVVLFHAGTKRAAAGIVTAGGRVLNVTAVGKDLTEARDRAYLAAARIHFDGITYRKDIGARALGGTSARA